jgi:lysophospholipase L1-like esterase
MKIQTGQKVVFIGDSITSAARNFDLGGEGHSDEAYGSGFVLMIKSILDAVYPERRIRVINRGVGGHTIRDLAARWKRDVLDLEPDWLTVMIGINDVWRQFDSPLQADIHVGPDEYLDTYRRLLGQARPSLKGLIIASPYVIDSNPEDAMRRRMDEYREMSRRVADEHDAIYVDTQQPFDRYLEHYHPNQLCWDRIHPSATGHMLIARAWLEAVDFAWSDETA